MNEIPNYTVFYDGECGFCNWSIAYVLKHEKNQKIHFVHLQSEISKQFFESRNLPQPDLSSVVYFRKDKVLDESSASLYIAKELKIPYNFLFAFIIVPKFIRDWVYLLIANRRHKIFKNYCVVPTKEQEKRFLS